MRSFTFASSLMLQPVIATRLRWERTWPQKAMLCAGFSVFTALMAQVAIPLPWTPVPITGQTFAVLLCGMVLGPRLGAASMGLYLLEGAIGLPVFAQGRSGWLVLVGVTGGYLWSFPLAAALVGALARRGWDRKPLFTVLAMAAGSMVIYALGLIWLAHWLQAAGKLLAGWSGVLQTAKLGMLPFLPGDAVKAGLAMVLLPTTWRWLNR